MFYSLDKTAILYVCLEYGKSLIGVLHTKKADSLSRLLNLLGT